MGRVASHLCPDCGFFSRFEELEKPPLCCGFAGTTSTRQAAASPEPSYIAYVRLERNWIDTEAGRASLGPGMTITTEIHTGQRRIIDYLLSPLQRKVSESLHER